MASNSLESTYRDLLHEVDPTSKDDPEFVKAWVDKVAGLTNVWRENHLVAPALVDRAEKETLEWIRNIGSDAQLSRRRGALASR